MQFTQCNCAWYVHSKVGEIQIATLHCIPDTCMENQNRVLENKWCYGQDKYSRKGLCNLSKTKYFTMNAKQNIILKGGALQASYLYYLELYNVHQISRTFCHFSLLEPPTNLAFHKLLQLLQYKYFFQTYILKIFSKTSMDSYFNDIEWKTIMQNVDVLMQVSTSIALHIIYIQIQI